MLFGTQKRQLRRTVHEKGSASASRADADVGTPFRLLASKDTHGTHRRRLGHRHVRRPRCGVPGREAPQTGSAQVPHPPLPRDAIRRGVVVDQAAVAQALRALWAKGKFSTKAVVIGIANEGVLVRQMDLDWMPPADFRKALHYQVAEALPVPVDEANLDYHLLEEVEVTDEHDGTVRRVNRILLVAAARDVVDGFVTAVQRAGLRVTRADLLPFALVRTAASIPADHQRPRRSSISARTRRPWSCTPAAGRTSSG
jgi:hypothetical protein